MNIYLWIRIFEDKRMWAVNYFKCVSVGGSHNLIIFFNLG